MCVGVKLCSRIVVKLIVYRVYGACAEVVERRREWVIGAKREWEED